MDTIRKVLYVEDDASIRDILRGLPAKLADKQGVAMNGLIGYWCQLRVNRRF